ncbi:hypothetical protein [Frankia sp. QA3]|uniref:hypothetical protein n=1 Tax=Frankia sp. QA3 TaxID=710111 RepID=UPI000269BC1C|nr:hypothetical protein [Frankia sp. QA3]EIV91296.1 hypothetical protein FraQA3DRAFT_0732 [Frankia sp. QA3]
MTIDDDGGTAVEDEPPPWPLKLSEESAWVLAPLGGISITSPFRLGRAVITLIDQVSWLMIERGDLVEEYDHLVDNGTVAVPFMVWEAGPDRSASAIFVDYGPEIYASFAALKLSGQDTLIDPRIIALYFRSGGRRRRDAGLNRREFGPYRERMYDGDFDVSPLTAECVRRGGELLEVLLSWLGRADEFERAPLDLFLESHLPHLSAGEKILFLFASLEAMSPVRTMFQAESGDLDVRLRSCFRENDLLTGLDPTTLRSVRNRLAHGEPDRELFTELVPKLQELTRCAILEWLSGT